MTWKHVWIMIGSLGLVGCGAQAPAATSAPPWTVHITGTPGTTWQGGCSTDTMNGTSNPTVSIRLPWTHHYPASVIDVNCYFQNQQSYGHAHLVILYKGRRIATGSAVGAYGTLGAYAQPHP